jgi:CheY-like chemotaxis protein
LWNLLSNAVRFTPPEGSIKVELQLFESQLELRVSDTGAGIKPEFLPHIFDRFTQADSSLKRSHGGLGMGLAIVKSIVQLHGGTVFASSPGLNEGSVFTVRLPMNIVRRDRAADGQTDSGVLEAWQERHELVGLKILVVDDQQDTCDLLRHVFDECGAIVETAQNARNALQVLDRWDPDILISDISMPSMDGYELIHTIRENRKSRIPAIALTAMARIDDRVKALNAGFQMHVAKPVDPMELISIVRSLTGLVNRH